MKKQIDVCEHITRSRNRRGCFRGLELDGFVGGFSRDAPVARQ